jgi:hypothetical protein
MTDLLHFCFVVIVLLCKVQKIDLGYSTPPDHCSHDKTKHPTKRPQRVRQGRRDGGCSVLDRELCVHRGSFGSAAEHGDAVWGDAWLRAPTS